MNIHENTNLDNVTSSIWFCFRMKSADCSTNTFTFCLCVYSTVKQVWSIAKQVFLNKEPFTIWLKASVTLDNTSVFIVQKCRKLLRRACDDVRLFVAVSRCNGWHSAILMHAKGKCSTMWSDFTECHGFQIKYGVVKLFELMSCLLKSSELPTRQRLFGIAYYIVSIIIIKYRVIHQWLIIFGKMLQRTTRSHSLRLNMSNSLQYSMLRFAFNVYSMIKLAVAKQAETVDYKVWDTLLSHNGIRK